MENQSQPTDDQSLLAAFAWWEDRRIIYNLIVGTIGLILMFPFFGFITWLWPVIYGIMANIFYTFGFIIEVAAKHYLKSKINFARARKILFVLGLIFSAFITVYLCFVAISYTD